MTQTDVNFNSNITLGLKTALLEAEVEINRLKDKLNQVALQCYKKIGETELNCMKQIKEFNEVKVKLQQELKDVRNELEQQKRIAANKENDNVNLQFKVKELKSLLDIKVEILESLNIKGDKFDKNTFIDCRISYKNLLKNLKIILKNPQYYPENQVLDDIRKCVYKSEKGRNFDINKYLRRIKTEKKDQDDDITDELAKQLEKFDYDPEINTDVPKISPINCSDDDDEPVANNIEFKIEIMEQNCVVNDNSETQEKSNTFPAENVDECAIMSDSDEENDKQVDFFKCSSQNKVYGSPEMPDLVQHVVPVTKECDNVNYNSDTNLPVSTSEREEQEVELLNEVVVDGQRFDKLAISLTVEEALGEMHKISKICSNIDVFRTFHDQNEIELEDCFKKPAPKKPIVKCSERNTNGKWKKMENEYSHISENLINSETPVIVEQRSLNLCDNIKWALSGDFDSTVISTNSSNTGLNLIFNCTENEENLNSVMNSEVNSHTNKIMESEVSIFDSEKAQKSKESAESNTIDVEPDDEVRSSVNAVKDSSSASIFDPEISSVEFRSNSDLNNSIDLEMNFKTCDKTSENQLNGVFESLANQDKELNKISASNSMNVVDNEYGDKPENTGNKFVNDLSEENSNLNFENNMPENIVKSSEKLKKTNSSVKSRCSSKSKSLKSVIEPVNKRNRNRKSVFKDPITYSIMDSDKNLNNAEVCTNSETTSNDLKSNGSVISVIDEKNSSKSNSDEETKPCKTVTSVCSISELYIKTVSNREKTVSSEKCVDLVGSSTNLSNTSAAPLETNSESVCVDDTVISISKTSDTMKFLSATNSEPKGSCLLSDKVIDLNCRTPERSKFEANEKKTDDLSTISPQNIIDCSMRKRKQKKKSVEFTSEFHNSEALSDGKPQECSKENEKPNDLDNNEKIEKIQDKPMYMNNGMGLRKRGGKYQEIIEQLVSKKRKISNGKCNISPKTTIGRVRKVRKRKCSDLSEDEEKIEKTIRKEKEIQSSEISSVSEHVPSITTDDRKISDSYENQVKNKTQSPTFVSKILCREVSEFDASSTSYLSEEEDVLKTNIEVGHSKEIVEFIRNDRKEPIHYEPYDEMYQNSPNDLINDDILPMENINALFNNSANGDAYCLDSPECVPENLENQVCSSEPVCDKNEDVVEVCNPNKPTSPSRSNCPEEQRPEESVASKSDNPEYLKSLDHIPEIVEVEDNSNFSDDDSPWSFLFKVDEKPQKIELDPDEMTDSLDSFCDDSVTHKDDEYHDNENINFCNISTQTEGLDEFENDNSTRGSPTNEVESKTENELVEDSNKSESENQQAGTCTSLKEVVVENRAIVDFQPYSNSEQIPLKKYFANSEKSEPKSEVTNCEETLDIKASKTLYEKSPPVRSIYDDFVKEKMSQHNESSNEKLSPRIQKLVDRELKNVNINEKASENHNLLHIRSDLTFLKSVVPKLNPNGDSAKDKSVDEILEEMNNLRDIIKIKNKTLTDFLKKECRVNPVEKKGNDYDCLVLLEFMSSEEETTSDVVYEMEHAVIPETKVETKQENEHLESDGSDESEEEEKLIIAEDYRADGTDGIEIKKFDTNKNDVIKKTEPARRLLAPLNSTYCSPISNTYESKIDMHTNIKPIVASTIKKNKNEVLENGLRDCSVEELTNLKEDSSSASVKLMFYTEMEVKSEGKLLTPFEEVWEILKTLHWNRPSIMNDEMVWCNNLITHMAYLQSTKPNFQRKHLEYSSNPKNYTNMLETFMKDYEKNPLEAMSNYRMKLMNHPTIHVVLNINTIVMSYCNSHIYEMKKYFDRILQLCCALEKDHQNIYSMLSECIREKLFIKMWKNDENLSMVECMIALSVFYAMIHKKAKNFQPVKNLIYESLCSLKFRAHPIAYGILNVCPGVFNGQGRDSILTQMILFTLIHHSMERNLLKFRVPEVISLVQKTYDLKVGEKAAEDYAKEAMYQLKDETWADAIFLLCKRQGFPWSYRNVIMKYFLQIVQKWKVEDFDEVILIKTVQALSKVVKNCPNKISENRTKTSTSSSQVQVQTLHTYNIELIVKSLSEVLYNPKGSRELHEIVAETICSISHLNFNLCSEILSNWKPLDNLISVSGLQQLNKCMHEGFVKTMWSKFVGFTKTTKITSSKKNKNKNISPNHSKGFIEVGKSKINRKDIRQVWRKNKQKL